MYRWKAVVFLTTSFVILCLEFYGRGKSDFENGEIIKEENDEEYESEIINEEDFPTLREWMDDRQLLYNERGRVVKEVCEKYKVKNVTSNSSVTDFINMSTHGDKGLLLSLLSLSFLPTFSQIILWRGLS